MEDIMSDCLYDTGDFPKLNKMERSDIKGTTGTHLVTSLNVFS